MSVNDILIVLIEKNKKNYSKPGNLANRHQILSKISIEYTVRSLSQRRFLMNRNNRKSND